LQYLNLVLERGLEVLVAVDCVRVEVLLSLERIFTATDYPVLY
jgi:hypothetical protein